MPALSLRQIDEEFEKLRAYTESSWSNLRINSRIARIRSLVRPDHTLGLKFSHVQSAVSEADDIELILKLIQELHRVVRESCIQRGLK